MTDLPASGYWSDNNRKEGEQKQWGEDIRNFVNQMLGGGLEETVTISSGSVTPTRGIVAVDTEGSTASDTLDVIAQANLPEGSLILVRAASSSRTVTVNHNSGSNGAVLLKSGANEDLAADQFLWLKRTGTTWEEVSQKDTALGTAATEDVDSFASDFLPDADSTRDLGSASKAWKEAHADQVLTDTLSDAAGTGPVDLIGQSAAKAWGYASSAFTLINSLNISSISDNGTGNMSWNFTNNFQTPETYSAQTNVGTSAERFIGCSTSIAIVNVIILTQASTKVDEINMITCNGTLA